MIVPKNATVSHPGWYQRLYLNLHLMYKAIEVISKSSEHFLETILQILGTKNAKWSYLWK